MQHESAVQDCASANNTVLLTEFDSKSPALCQTITPFFLTHTFCFHKKKTKGSMLFEFDHYLVKRNTCSLYLGLPRFGSQSSESNRDRRKGEEKHQAIFHGCR